MFLNGIAKRLVAKIKNQTEFIQCEDKFISFVSIKEKKFYDQFELFKESVTNNRFELKEEDFWKCLDDKTESTQFDRHYIYHTAWAARNLAETNPDIHTDISSQIYFVTIASAFVPIKFYDYRPAKIILKNLESNHVNLLDLPFEDQSIKSLSCMHVVEHVGLGRYGDDIDYDGDLKAMSELKRILAPGGDLFFVVPIGNKPKIQFNAHRIYTKEQILACFSNLTLIEFALIENEGEGGLIVDPPAEILLNENYACGCFWFKKCKRDM